MNGYELSRNWFDWCFENPDKITPTHTAMYFFIIEHCNRLGWKEKFGLPMEMTKDAIGISNYRTFSKVFNDLVEWNFIIVHQKSKNQYSSNIIAIVQNTKANTKALDKAMQKQSQKQVHGTVCIDKHINIEHNNIITSDYENLEYSFDEFWKLYPNKVGKKLAKEKFEKLNKHQKEKIEQTLPIFITNIPFKDYSFPHATTYLNQERYNDEIILNNNKNGITKFTTTDRFKEVAQAIRTNTDGIRY